MGRYIWLSLLLALSTHAEQGFLVVHAKNPSERPLANVRIGAEGDGGDALTDTNGKARIKLAPQTRASGRVTLTILKAPRDLVFISPWDRRATVPPFENESENYVSVVLAERGDRAMLENGKALLALAASINKSIAPQPPSRPGAFPEKSAEDRSREALEEVARQFGLAPGDIDKAIRTWGEKTGDPYEKGLAALYEKDYPLATSQLTDSLRRREERLKEDQSSVADAAFFLGRALYGQGKYRDAVTQFRRAADLRPDDGVSLRFLGTGLLSSGDYAAADPVLRRAVAIAERTKGLNDPETGASLNNLAQLLYDKGDYAAAEPLFRRALAIAEQSQGPDHPDTGTSLNNLASLLQAKGDYAAAEPLLRRALAIAEKAQGPDHPDTGISLNNLASLLQAKGDYAAAEPLLRRALAIAEKSLGTEHPTTRLIRKNLADLQQRRTAPQNPR